MQSLFILPISYFINRLLYPYSMSYIRLSYDETIIEFNGSKLKMNPFLPQSNRHTLTPSYKTRGSQSLASLFSHVPLPSPTAGGTTKPIHEFHHQQQPLLPPPRATAAG